MRFATLRIVLSASLALFLQGCISSGIIEESSHPSQIPYKLREYNEAFIQGDQLVINGKAARKGGRKKEYSVAFKLDPESGLPHNVPLSVQLKKVEKSESSILIDLHYISLPIENPTNPKEAESYSSAVVETSRPSVYINTYTKEDFGSDDAVLVNNFHALYVPTGEGSKRVCAPIIISPYRKSESNRALLLALPAAAIVDVITLPVQTAIEESIMN
jgi:hypothetical protein